MATIQDVAKAANVSISTVSRVVNGKNNVSYDKKERVLEAIRETGYIPPVRNEKSDSASFGQGQGSLGNGGFILVVSNVIHKELFSSLRENAQDCGYEALFLVTETETFSEQTKSSIQTLQKSGLVRGIALINPLYNRPDLYNAPFFQSLPMVLIDATYQGSDLCFVGNDDYHAAYEMTNFLLQRYKSAAYLSVFTRNNPEGIPLSFGPERQRGFVDAMRAHGFSDDSIQILYPEHTFTGGKRSARELLERGSLPEAVLCGSDYVALGLIHELEKNNYRIPDDIGVACISGENEFPDILHPQLTRIRQSFDDIGHAAIGVLDDLIQKNFSTQRSILISYQLVPGETTKV